MSAGDLTFSEVNDFIYVGEHDGKPYKIESVAGETTLMLGNRYDTIEEALAQRHAKPLRAPVIDIKYGMDSRGLGTGFSEFIDHL